MVQFKLIMVVIKNCTNFKLLNVSVTDYPVINFFLNETCIFYVTRILIQGLCQYVICHNTQENVEIIFVFQNFVKKIKKLFVLMNKMLVNVLM
jgi:hypothetical protein